MRSRQWPPLWQPPNEAFFLLAMLWWARVSHESHYGPLILEDEAFASFGIWIIARYTGAKIATRPSRMGGRVTRWYVLPKLRVVFNYLQVTLIWNFWIKFSLDSRRLNSGSKRVENPSTWFMDAALSKRNNFFQIPNMRSLIRYHMRTVWKKHVFW